VNTATGDPTPDKSIRAAERQRISRELHNSTSQLLVALQLQLGELRKCPGVGAAQPLLDEIAQTLQDIHGTVKLIGQEPADDQDLEGRQVRTARLFYSLSGIDHRRR